MTFREQAAITFYQTEIQRERHALAPKSAESLYLPSDAVRDAQELADACCAQWDHDYAGYKVGTSKPHALADGEVCRRCGAVYER